MIGVVVGFTGIHPGTKKVTTIEHLFEYEEWMGSNRVSLFAQVARDGQKYMTHNVNLEWVTMDKIEIIYE